MWEKHLFLWVATCEHSYIQRVPERRLLRICISQFKGTQAWHFFNTFFAETETIWSQGPVTRDFWKSYSIRPRYSTLKHFHACSACDEIGSAYAQHAMKKFVPRMLSMYCTCKNVHILQLAEHARKFVPRMLSVWWNRFRVCWACDKIVSEYAQHMHAIIFEKYSKIPNWNANFD